MRVILKGAENKTVPEGLTPEIVSTTAAWAIYGAVKQWFYTPDHQTSSEAVGPILNLVLPILSHLAPLSTEQHEAYLAAHN